MEENYKRSWVKKPKERNLNDMDGKLPPQVIEFEESVLGALMCYPEIINIIFEILEAKSFYKDQNARIYSAILNLYKKSNPTDMVSVTQELKRMGELEIVGGAYYITTLTNNPSYKPEYHARIISQKYIQRELIRVCTQSISAAYEEGTDVFDLLDAHEKEYTGIIGKINGGKIETIPTLFNQMVKRNEALLLNKGVSGVPTGFPALDKITGGWQDAEMIVIAARPSMGKTALALALARNAAVDFSKPTAIFSLEMSSLALATRLFASEANLSTSDFIRRGITPDMMVVVQNDCTKLINSSLYLDDTPGLTLLQFRSKARKMARDHKIELIIIDYLQLMAGDTSNKNGNREQEIASISRGIKQVAKELGIPIIALSQLSRAVETRGGDKRPMLSDLRESGAIEQDADVVMFIHRPEYYKIMEDENGNSTVGIAEIITAKNRNGPVGDAQIGYIAPSTKFHPLDPDRSNREVKDFTVPQSTLTPDNSFSRHDIIEDHPY